MTRQHDCLLYLRTRESRCVEAHGLDCGPYEEWTYEWTECGLCGRRFDQDELRELHLALYGDAIGRVA